MSIMIKIRVNELKIGMLGLAGNIYGINLREDRIGSGMDLHIFMTIMAIFNIYKYFYESKDEYREA